MEFYVVDKEVHLIFEFLAVVGDRVIELGIDRLSLKESCLKYVVEGFSKVTHCL
jgi:hypothetical protein